MPLERGLQSEVTREPENVPVDLEAEVEVEVEVEVVPEHVRHFFLST